ncbi:hypothetical protein [Zavarzinella formosa]|uniref:hypothetical protein n=1 Tax=Zavarzinella formosa TaxID=360055 RepID=UPI0002E2912E|nr:hypothetical protein [Zavarzinella formosa]
MAISCNCPFCATSYRLKDEFAGKKVTCKNAVCRKVFEVPSAKPEPVLVAKPLDVDALAAATFSDEPKVEEKVETTIEVVCFDCGHRWQVESSKAGKNIRCPNEDCGKINKVPLPKVETKIDWRDSNKGRPTFAAPKAAPKVAGGFDAGEVATISMETAQKMVREQDDEEEPGVARKRWIKRGVYGVILLAGVGYLGNMLYKGRKVVKEETNIADALKEIRNPEYGAKDTRFHAIVLRASGEYKARSSTKRDETEAALNDFKAARNLFKQSDSSTDQIMILADIALSMSALLGTDEEAERGKKISKETLLKEIRQTIDRMPIGEPEPIYELLRNLTREFQKQKQGILAAQLAIQKFPADSPEGQEALGVVGVELFRQGDKAGAEEVMKKTNKNEASSIQTLRLLLDKPAPVIQPPPAVPGKGPVGKAPNPKDNAPPPQKTAATVVQLIQKGKIAEVKAEIAKSGTEAQKVRNFVLAAEYAIPIDGKTPIPPEVGVFADEAAKFLADKSKNTIAGWWTMRVCRLYAKLGKPDRINQVADQNSNDQMIAWAKTEGLRVRLSNEPETKALESWAEDVGDPVKSAAAAKARELVARQNASIDNSFQRIVDIWTRGTVRPFGLAGTMLGRQDRAQR